jgi:hypothetical protein
MDMERTSPDRIAYIAYEYNFSKNGTYLEVSAVLVELSAEIS